MDWLQPVVDFVKSLKCWAVIQPWQGAIHLRLGRVRRTLGPGWYLLMPVLDSVWEVNTLKRVTDIGPLPLTTRDGLNVTAAAVVTWEVGDVLVFQTSCEDTKEALHDSASGALAHAVLAHDWADIPNEPFIGAVCTAVRRTCKRYGIRVITMRWTGIAQTRPLALWTVGHGGGNVPGSGAAAVAALSEG